ncbi:MAG: ABC transporter substrate-binding protein [bacterium]
MSITKTLRKYYWVSEAFTKRHYKTVLSATLCGTILLGLVVFLLQYIPTYKHATRIAKIGKYTTTSLPDNILKKISVGLVTTNSSGAYEKGLAESWKIDNDGKQYTFIINKNLSWHDGKSLEPSDIGYSFKEVTQSIKDNQLIYTLQEPFSPFLSALTKPILRNNKLGVGEYRIGNIEEYGGNIQKISLNSKTKQLIYKFYPTENSAITAFKLGEVDQIENLSYIPKELKEEPQNIIAPFLEDQKIAVLFLNNNDSVLSSKPTRQALAYAISDKSFGNKRAISPVSSTSWAYNDSVKTYDFDQEKAKTLLKTDIQNPANLKIELKTMLQYLDIAEKIAENWNNTLGITVDVKVINGITNDYQVLLADYAPPLDPDQYSIWHSTQSTNFTHYTNLKVDKLLEDGRRTLDSKLRIEIYQDFQRFLLEDSPAIFLFETNSSTVSRKPIFK